jgi:hypothetical protein
MKLHWTIFILPICLLLNACGGNTSPESPSLLSGKVNNYTLGAGNLIAVEQLGDFEFSGKNVGKGQIQADGTFTLQLDEVSETILSAGTILFCDDLQVSDKNTRIYTIAQLYLQLNGAVTGTLLQASANFATNTIRTGDKAIVRWYADRDTTIKGSCDSATLFNLELKKGWNRVVFEAVTDAQLKASTTTSAQGIEWIFTPFSSF